MYHTQRKNLIFGLAVLLGLTATNAMAETLLHPGYAVHTFGTSPHTNDANYTIRVYDTTESNYSTSRPVTDIDSAITNESWTIDAVGNVFGIAIDKQRNIYVGSSANWSPGYVGEGDTNGTVKVQYGSLDQSDRNSNSGVVYKLESENGDAEVFSKLPQTETTITNEVCEGTENNLVRQTGPGLGNIAYDKIHDQIFVSDFSDGRIYRVSMDGTVLDSFDASYQDIDLKGLKSDNKTLKSPYGLAVSPDGQKLYYGTMETNYYPKLFAVTLTKEGNFTSNIIDQDAKLVEKIRYTQNIGGDTVNDGTWVAYADLDFTPDGELLVGLRVGCKNNFATSYNHGGVVYLLKKDSEGKYNLPSDKTTPTEEQNTTYTGSPEGDNSPETRAGRANGSYKFDAGAIPLHPDTDNDEDKIKRGPDDGYGGVAVWQKRDGFDLYATSADIMAREGVHGFMQFSGEFNITSTATIDKVRAYKSVGSTTDDSGVQDAPRDYKGIGGDVEVLSVIPMCIGSVVWEDTDKRGDQNESEPRICDAKVKLISADTNNSVIDIDGNPVLDQNTSCEDGQEGTYKFCNLPEGRYRVCVATPKGEDHKYIFAPTDVQTKGDNNDSELDSNIAYTENGFHCSGIYDLWANTEPVEENTKDGDGADNNADKLGNMTVDFGFIKQTFDLALIKELMGDPEHRYAIGEKVQFKITVTNQGDINATDVFIQDTLPEGLELADDEDRWESNGTLKTPIALIEPGANASVEINCTVTGDVGQQDAIINVAEIADASNPYDLNDTDSIPGENLCDNDMNNDNNYSGGESNGCDDVDPAQILIEQTFDLAIQKTVDGDKESYQVGDEVRFTITVYNQGTLDAHEVKVTDHIPDGLTLKAGQDEWTQNGNDVTRNIGDVDANTSKSVPILFVVNESAENNKTIVNIGEITHAENDLGKDDNDSNTSENPCMQDQDDDPDFADNGCDDVDPALVKIIYDIGSDTYTPPKSKSSSSSDKDCDCDHVESNKVDSMSLLFVLLMLAGTWMLVVQSQPRKRRAS